MTQILNAPTKSSEAAGTSDYPPRIAAELNRIADALRDPSTTSDKYCQLYAAQQALTWSAK